MKGLMVGVVVGGVGLGGGGKVKWRGDKVWWEVWYCGGLWEGVGMEKCGWIEKLGEVWKRGKVWRGVVNGGIELKG